MTISQTLFIGSRVMKLGQQVACRETFKIMRHWVIFTEGQGHSLESQDISICDCFTQYLRHYLSYSYEIPPKGSLSGDLQNDVTLGDLDKKSKTHSLLIFVTIFFTIFQTVFVGNTIMIMKFGPKVACD